MRPATGGPHAAPRDLVGERRDGRRGGLALALEPRQLALQPRHAGEARGLLGAVFALHAGDGEGEGLGPCAAALGLGAGPCGVHVGDEMLRGQGLGARGLLRGEAREGLGLPVTGLGLAQGALVGLAPRGHPTRLGRELPAEGVALWSHRGEAGLLLAQLQPLALDVELGQQVARRHRAAKREMHRHEAPCGGRVDVVHRPPHLQSRRGRRLPHVHAGAHAPHGPQTEEHSPEGHRAQRTPRAVDREGAHGARKRGGHNTLPTDAAQSRRAAGSLSSDNTPSRGRRDRGDRGDRWGDFQVSTKVKRNTAQALDGLCGVCYAGPTLGVGASLSKVAPAEWSRADEEAVFREVSGEAGRG
jgi:hypothetical protein